MTQRPLSAFSLGCGCVTMANLRLLDLIALFYLLTSLSSRYSQIKQSPDLLLRLWLFLFSLLLRFILPTQASFVGILSTPGLTQHSTLSQSVSSP